MDKMIEQAMKTGSKKRPAPKHLKEFHAKEQSDGKYHVVRHSGKPTESAHESTAADMNEVHAALEDHMGAPNDGEAEAEPAMGGGDPSQMGAGQPGMGGM